MDLLQDTARVRRAGLAGAASETSEGATEGPLDLARRRVVVFAGATVTISSSSSVALDCPERPRLRPDFPLPLPLTGGGAASSTPDIGAGFRLTDRARGRLVALATGVSSSDLGWGAVDAALPRPFLAGATSTEVSS
jgi:hypothetical protein